MRRARTAGAAMLALLLAVLIAACQGGEEPAAEPSATDAEAGAAIAARLMTVGEPLGTIVESRAAAIVPGLQVALNPSTVAAISSAVGAADDAVGVGDLRGSPPSPSSRA